jgi:hypothetical protein
VAQGCCGFFSILTAPIKAAITIQARARALLPYVAYQWVAKILPIRRMSRERKKMRYYSYLANLKLGIESRHLPLFVDMTV